METLVFALGVIALALAALCAALLFARATTLARCARAEEHAAAAAQELDMLTNPDGAMHQAIGALASAALKESREQLLVFNKSQLETEQVRARSELEQRKQAVEHLVKPIAEALKKTEEKLGSIESERKGAYASLVEQVRAMQEGGASLRNETRKLTQALRKPQVRGRYGEIQLERVAELAGMREYCDFETQTTVTSDAGVRLRPDMIVRLPNERVVVVDAKTNLEAYLDALDAQTPEEAEAKCSQFADHVANQAKALASKEYWGAIHGAVDFVVMFIPGDQFVDTALAHRPDLLDLAATERVIIASPSTLIGLLRAVHVGWREKRLTDDAAELFELGKQLHERAAVAMGHAASLGKAIQATVERFNKFVGSVDTRLMPTLRRFEASGAQSAKQLCEPALVDQSPRLPATGTPDEAPVIEIPAHTAAVVPTDANTEL